MILAQAAATPENWTDLLWQLAQQYGLLGILFALVVLALVRRDRDLTSERDGRLNDAKQIIEMVKQATAAEVQLKEALRDLSATIEKKP